MKIKSIQLNNFRQYKGNQPAILFSTDNDKNVTVILGVNTSGKTTLVQAFLWCLYGSCSFKTKEVLNAEAADEMKGWETRDVAVEIILIHEAREYTIRRTQKFHPLDNGNHKADDQVLKMQYKEDNGEHQSIPLSEREKTITRILPEGLSDYFFFDGERITDIGRRDVVSAVRGLMGLDVLGEARDRLDPNSAKSVTSKFIKELDTGSDQKSGELIKKLTTAQEKLEVLINRREKAKEEIQYYEKRKGDLSQKLSANSQAKQNQERRERIERDLRNYQDNIAQSEAWLKKSFQQGALSFFALPLIEYAKKVINESKQDGAGIPEMRQAAIDHILERNKCICGCDLHDNEGAKKNIRYERSLLPPEHIGTMIRKQQEAYQQFEESSSGYIQTVIKDYRAYRTNVNHEADKQDELNDINKTIASSPSIDIVRIEQDYSENQTNLTNKQELYEKTIKDIGAIENEIENTQKSIQGLTITTEKNKRLQKYILYSNTLFQRFNDEYLEHEKEVKEGLLESVNSIFQKMYHGERIVSINDRYQITLSAQMDTGTKDTDESKGLEVVKNFAFITGLVNLARRKLQAKETSDQVAEYDKKLQITTEPYPLVMDAPFSNADEIHIKNISRIVPEIAEQVILIAMKKDWEFAKYSLGGKVGRCYEIEKVHNSETNSIIKGAQYDV